MLSKHKTRCVSLWFFSVVGCAVLQFQSSQCCGQDAVEVGRQALINGKYTWYNPETDSLQPLKPVVLRPAASSNRSLVPMRDIPAQTPSGTFAPTVPTTRASNWIPAWLSTASVWLTVAAGLAALTIVLMWAFFKRESSSDRRNGGGKEKVRTDADRISHLPFELMGDVAGSQGDLSDRAREAVSRGDGRLAAVLLYGQVLVSLDQKGLIRLMKGKTNRNYLAEVLPFTPIAEYFQEVMIPFEQAFFGDYEVSTQTVESCMQQYEQFLIDVERETKVKYS